LEQAYGLIIRTDDNQFIFAGNGVRITFAPAKPSVHPGVSVGMIEEGRLNADGEWQRRRIIGGGEVIGTNGVKLPADGFSLGHDRNNMTILRMRLFLHPPVSADQGGSAVDTAPEY
jgi:hypothetical protein